MPDPVIVVKRAGGRLHQVKTKEPGLDRLCRQVVAFARNAAVHGCPLGDAAPPEWVELRDEGGDVVVRIVIDESLAPEGGSTL